MRTKRESERKRIKWFLNEKCFFVFIMKIPLGLFWINFHWSWGQKFQKLVYISFCYISFWDMHKFNMACYFLLQSADVGKMSSLDDSFSVMGVCGCGVVWVCGSVSVCTKCKCKTTYSVLRLRSPANVLAVRTLIWFACRYKNCRSGDVIRKLSGKSSNWFSDKSLVLERNGTTRIWNETKNSV